mmetsp:Transcript_22209/g.20187  ORF Transcript_22209/g.20187 Transcript_22209/m.20187 type:complete len:230 (-) Transcript_22209:2685-3374(-)
MSITATREKYRTVDWSENETAKTVAHVMKYNRGSMQQIIENKVELLDWLTVEELKEIDDLGITLPYFAVFYNRPEMIEYLHRRGVDLSQPCDSESFGNAMFYAVSMRRYDIVKTLDQLSYSVKHPCDIFNQFPIDHATRINDKSMIDLINKCANKETTAAVLFLKNFLRHKQRRIYLCIIRSAFLINRIFRGGLVRLHLRKYKAKVLQYKQLGMILPSFYSYDDDDEDD